MQEYPALVHSLLAAGIPFALFPADPTPYELKHLVKVSKIRKIFTSLRNLEKARIAAKEGGFSESEGIFVLEGKVKGKRSFDDLVRSVKEPAKDYAKAVDSDALAYLIFSSGTTGLPKGEAILQDTDMLYCSCSPRRVVRRHDIAQEYGVLSDAGHRRKETKRSGRTSQFLSERDSTTFRLTSAVDFRPSPRGPLAFQFHWSRYHFTTVTG